MDKPSLSAAEQATASKITDSVMARIGTDPHTGRGMFGFLKPIEELFKPVEELLYPHTARSKAHAQGKRAWHTVNDGRKPYHR
jgi:hypothetical protein